MKKMYEEFVTYVEENILSKMPEADKRKVVIRDVVKNNNMVLTSLSMPKEDEIMAPVFYLDFLYEEYYHREVDLDVYLNEISSRYCLAEEKSCYPFDLKMLKKENIFCAVVPRTDNEEFLRDLMFYPLNDDFAVVFKFYLEGLPDGDSGTVLITDAIAQGMNYSLKDLRELAIQNTPRLFPLEFGTMFELMLKSGLLEEDSFLMEQLREKQASGETMYYLTNEQRHLGATVLLYPETGKMLYEHFKTDIVLIPSSIHEWLILPYDEEMDFYYLCNQMVEINVSVKEAGEMLGEHPYRIRRENLLKSDCLFSVLEDLVVFEP